MAAPTTAGVGRRDLAPASGRFRALDEALDRPGVRVLSIDVFDTLLCRRVPKPSDAHLLLGRVLANDKLLKPHLTPRLFARLRVLAEEEARAQRARLDGSSEVRLADICAVLAPSVTDCLGAEELAARELDHERAVTFPDRAVIAHLEQVRGRLQLIAVSDTYLSAIDVRSLLDHHGMGELEFADIFTSSEVGNGKGAGLWKHVIGELGVDPAAIVHAGDNFDADVAAGAQAGIAGVHLPVSTDRFADVVDREQILGGAGDPSPWCDERLGDGGITAVRRRATLLAAPITNPSPEEEVTWQTGTAVLGPVFAGYAQWVHERAAALGAQRALCLMREGRFLLRLLEGASGEPGHRLRAQTAWASREGCARASIYEGSEDELRTFLSRLNAPGPQQVAGSLGLDPAQVPQLRAVLGRFDSTTTGEEAAAGGEAVVELVLGREDLRQAVVDRSRALRRRLVAHLLASAGPGEGPVLVVDVGWAGSILEALQRMLVDEGADLSLHGLFVLAHIGSAGPLLRGVPLEGYLGDSGFVPFDVAGITGNPELVELACMCDEGTFLELDADGDPVLAPTWTTPRQSERRTLLQDGIAAFQAAWLRQRDPATSYETSDAGRATLRRVLERFLSLPDREEVQAFAWWGHEENFGSDSVDQMVPEALRPTLHLRTADSLHFAPPSQLYWVGGAAGLVDPATADAVFLMRRGVLAPGRLTAGVGIGAATVALAGTDGSERVVAEVPLSANRRGVCFVEWRGDLQGAVEVRICPAEQPAILRLDWLEVVCHDGSGTTIGRRAWAPGGTVHGFDVREATAIAAHIYAIDGRTRLALTVPADTDTRSLTVAMAGSYLPIAGTTGGGAALVDVGQELTALRNELAALHRTKLFRAAALPRRLYGRLRRGGRARASG